MLVDVRPLWCAAFGGHLQVAEFLLRHGADPDVISIDSTALHIASLFGLLDIVKLLVEYGAGKFCFSFVIFINFKA